MIVREVFTFAASDESSIGTRTGSNEGAGTIDVAGQPDVPRTLDVRVTVGALTGPKRFDVTVVGTSVSGAALSETIEVNLASGASSSLSFGTRAFAKVTSLTWARFGSSPVSFTISVGRGTGIGLSLKGATGTSADLLHSTTPSGGATYGNTVNDPDQGGPAIYVTPTTDTYLEAIFNAALPTSDFTHAHLGENAWSLPIMEERE